MRPSQTSATERVDHEIAQGRRIADRAEQIWGWGTPAGQARASRRARFLIEHGEITSTTYLLEVGCGTGIFTTQLASTGARIDAIDISPALLERACARHSHANVSYIAGNVEAGENLLGPYDAVVGVSILHHLDLSLALPCLVRVLKPGGRFVFTEPNLLNPQVWLQKNVMWIKKRLGDSPDETAFVRTKLAALLAHHGLANILITPFDWLHPWTPRRMISVVETTGLVLEQIPFIREISGSLLIVARKP